MALSVMWLKYQCLSTSLLQDYMQIHKSFVYGCIAWFLGRKPDVKTQTPRVSV